MEYPKSIEENYADFLLSQGTVKVTEYGEENTYYEDMFGNQFYCKNYPQSEYRYPVTYCSQCGESFGPGNHGYSHCDSHK